MATKLKKTQKSRRYEGGTGLSAPAAYRAEVLALAADPLEAGGHVAPGPSPELRRFAALLRQLIERGNTYAEMEALKPLCAFVVWFGTQQAAQWEGQHQGEQQEEEQERRERHAADLARMQALLAEVLLLPNSRALHKQLLSSLRPLLLAQQAQRQWAAAGAAAPPGFAEAAAERIAQLAAGLAACGGSGCDSGPALLLGSALAALLAQPACKPALARCAVPAVAALAAGVRQTLAAADGQPGVAAPEQPGEGAGAAITTIAMDGLQDSISALYFLLSSFGRDMLVAQPEAGAAAVLAAGEALLAALQGQVLVREALASAAVALYAAAVLPSAPPSAAARCFSAGLLLAPPRAGGGEALHGQAALAPSVAPGQPLGLLDAHLRQRDADGTFGGPGGLVKELRLLPPLSRLCALRGLLSATPAAVLCAPLPAARSPPDGALPGTDAAGAMAPPEEPTSRPWLLLVDGALPHIATAIQGTTDEHFRFHAHSTLSVCLARVRHQQEAAVAALAGGPTVDACMSSGGQTLAGQPADGKVVAGQDLAAEEETQEGPVAMPLLDASQQRLVLQLLWQGFEAPLSQTLARVVASFDCLLDIMRYQWQLQDGTSGTASDEALLGIARELLAVDASRKGRYPPLQLLIPRVGAAPLLALQPGLVAGCLEAARQHLISSAVANVLLALVAQLKLEAGAEKQPVGGANGSTAAAAPDEAAAGWRAAWLPALAAALRHGDEAQRDNLAAHLLPRLLSQDPPALGLLLRTVLPSARGATNATGAATSGAEGSPAAAAIDSSASGGTREGGAAACLAVLKAARRQQMLDDLHRLPLAGLDAAAVRAALLAAVRSSNEGLRCPHSSLRHKALAPLGRLLMRQRGAVAALLAKPGRPGSQAAAASAKAVAAQQRWLHWLSGTLLDSLYPGASHERSFMALELLALLLEAFGDLVNPALPPPSWCKVFAVLRPDQFDPVGPRFCSKGTVQLLLAAALDSWERLREAAAAVLLQMPTPLPGFATPGALQPLLRHALGLLGCARGREVDAGAQLLLLLLRKYGGAGSEAAACCWHLDLDAGTIRAPEEAAPPTAAVPPPAAATPTGAILEAAFTKQQQQQQQQQREDERARRSAALWAFLSSGAALLQRRVALAERDMLEACRGGLAQGVLLGLRYALAHLPWQQLAEEQAAGARDWRGLLGHLIDLTYAVSDLTLPILSKPQDQNTDAADVNADDVTLEEASGGTEEAGGTDALGPRAQIINTGCWQSSKECGLLLGGLARTLPLEGPGALLTAAQLRRMADHFTRLLCELKHNGAVDKAQQGFTALLLQQPDAALRQLPQRCLQQLLAFARRPDQGQSDIVRRSAGLPFAVVAIFSAEPASSQKALLHRGMTELLATAGEEGQGQARSWPRVHALNCLRMGFQDADLAVDTSAHLAQGLQTAILGMAAAQWEVRSAASMCYAALLMRVLGFRNSAGQGTVAAKRAPTAADFFARHSTLHPFLLRQLAAATATLPGGGGGSDAGDHMHPSLFPVLVLLSRLRASQHNRLAGSGGSSELAEARLSPAAFAPLLQRAAAAPALAVRRLAAAALPPLLPPETQSAAAAELAAAVAAAAAGSQPRPSFNAMHGQLLQLRALLESAAQTADSPAAAALLGAIAAPLAACAARACCLDHATCNGGASRLPAAVSLEYIRAAAAAARLLLVARQQQQQEQAAHGCRAAAAWLAAVEDRCWAAVERSAASGPAPRDYLNPMLAFAAKHATRLCFDLLLRRCGTAAGGDGCAAAGDELLRRLGVALRSGLYEVRGAALKVVLRQLRPDGADAPAAAAAQRLWLGERQAAVLRRLLVQRLAGEGHHKAQRRLLHLLALLPPPDGEGGPPATPAGDAGNPAAPAGEQFAAMLARAQVSGDARIRQYAIQCLGPLLRALLRAQHGMPADERAGAAAAAAQLLALVADCSQPWQLPELRLAAAAAVAASGLLALDPTQSDAAAEAAADAWAAALWLAEDEEDGVRQVAAAALAHALAGFSLHAATGQRGASPAAGDGTAEPAEPSDERVLRRALPALATRFGPHPALLALLCRLACPAAAAPPAADTPAASAAAAAAAAAAEKLFDREPDNMHKEPLLMAQLAARSLAQLLLEVAPDGAASALAAAWAASALALLQRLEATLRREEGEQGARGCSAVQPIHHRYFERLYCCWLALLVAAQLPDGGDGSLAGMAAAVAGLAAGPAGPAAALGSAPQLVAVAAAAAAAWERRGAGVAVGPELEQLLFLT